MKRLILSLLLGFTLLFQTACVSSLTIRPTPVVATQASLDGNVANSGAVAETPDYAVVTPHWVERYNALVKIYGKRWTPPLRPIAPAVGEQHVTLQQSADFSALNRYRKSDTSVK